MWKKTGGWRDLHLSAEEYSKDSATVTGKNTAVDSELSEPELSKSKLSAVPAE